MAESVVTGHLERSRGLLARHVLVVALWFAAFHLLAEYAVFALPRSFAEQLTLQSYLTGVQLSTLALGLALAFLLLRDARVALGFELPRPLRVGALALLAPAIYVAASYFAIYVALPTLLAELERGGRQAVQQSTGEFGRELVQAGLLSAVVWGVVVSPLGEELLFRGALWSLVQRVVALLRPARPVEPASEALPAGMLSESIGLCAARATRDVLLDGGVATLVSAGVFAWMHADMPGGLGIVRWVSALGLGLAAGAARQASGSVAGACAVHVGFNLCSLATTRRWVVTDSFPMKRGVPTLLSLIGGALLLVVMIGWFGVWAARRRDHMPSSS